MIFNAKGFLFDMDGTLVDSTAVVESVWRDFCAEYGLDSQAVIAYAHGRQTIDTLTHFIGAGEKTNKIAASLEEVEINTTEGVTEVKGAAALLSKLPPDSWALVTSAGRMLAENRMKAASTGCVNSEWPALAGVKGIFAEDNYPKRKRIYQLGDAIADCCKSRMDGVGYYPGLLSTDRYCLLDHP